MKLNELTGHELAARLRSGEVSSHEATAAVLDHIQATDPKINAFISVDADGALAQADEVDSRRVSGDELGPLAGIPVAVKDLICVAGGRTTCGSRILADYVAPYDATVIDKLRTAGAVIVGKTNMDEFAMGSSTENSHFGVTHNPCDPARVPGGSSGGSAAAVAAHETILALGSDTGGSVRQPAAYCGVVGMKPTYGRVSRYGLVAYASSLDQIGPVTKDVEDTALLLQAISGHDPHDATSLRAEVPAYSQTFRDSIKGLRVGLARQHFPAELDSEIASASQQAADRLAQSGVELIELDLPVAGHGDYCLGAYYLIAMGEASANLARYDGVKFGHRAGEVRDLEMLYARTRSEGFGTEVKRRIMLGTYALSAGYYDAYYLKAQKVRTLIRQDFARAFSRCDALLAPVAPGTAFKIGEKVDDPLQMYLTDIYTVAINLAGLPGISVPCARSHRGLPIGVQLVSAPLQEERLLQLAHALEQSSGSGI
jgi:aspartyl-tRNA(Asn)/glutamyl-tRNA(Gln) amidotransferase subunit A